MYKLRRLILCDNEILDLTNELGNLVSLEEFDISKNGKFSFSSLPAGARVIIALHTMKEGTMVSSPPAKTGGLGPTAKMTNQKLLGGRGYDQAGGLKKLGGLEQ